MVFIENAQWLPRADTQVLLQRQYTFDKVTSEPKLNGNNEEIKSGQIRLQWSLRLQSHLPFFCGAWLGDLACWR